MRLSTLSLFTLLFNHSGGGVGQITPISHSTYTTTRQQWRRNKYCWSLSIHSWVFSKEHLAFSLGGPNCGFLVKSEVSVLEHGSWYTMVLETNKLIHISLLSSVVTLLTTSEICGVCCCWFCGKMMVCLLKLQTQLIKKMDRLPFPLPICCCCPSPSCKQALNLSSTPSWGTWSHWLSNHEDPLLLFAFFVSK